MSNQTFRKRFGLSIGSRNTASGIIVATIEQGLTKLDSAALNFKKFARYLPI